MSFCVSRGTLRPSPPSEFGAGFRPTLCQKRPDLPYWDCVLGIRCSEPRRRIEFSFKFLGCDVLGTSFSMLPRLPREVDYKISDPSLASNIADQALSLSATVHASLSRVSTATLAKPAATCHLADWQRTAHNTRRWVSPIYLTANTLFPTRGFHGSSYTWIRSSAVLTVRVAHPLHCISDLS